MQFFFFEGLVAAAPEAGFGFLRVATADCFNSSAGLDRSGLRMHLCKTEESQDRAIGTIGLRRMAKW